MAEATEKKTILVIEDDEDVLKSIIEYLESAGYRIIFATDGMEGLKMLESEKYDLVITDLVMPFVSGVGVITALKEKHPHIPVIAITGYGKEPTEAAVEKNADAVLGKPITTSVLKDHIDKLLSVSVPT